VELPRFRYHPDPLATGMIVVSGEDCVVCEQARGYLYSGVPFCEEEVDEESICSVRGTFSNAGARQLR
jgi:uncharacterized protein